MPSGSSRGRQKQRAAKAVMWLMGIGIVGYIVGPPLYWHLTDILTLALRHPSASSYCPPCFCDCSSHPLLSLLDVLRNNSFLDCMKYDSEVSKDMERDYTEMVSEELKKKEAEALENQHRGDVALLDAKKLASQYQKEAEKCNSGMETCEEAREKSEVALEEQRKLSAMWELRARQRGWKEGTTMK